MGLGFMGMLQAQTYPTTSWRDEADTSWYNDDQTEFDISTAEELAGLSQLVEEGNDFEDITINLTADIDLDGHLWEPIGFDNDAPFSGIVQGNGHLISNLWITGLNRSFIGLFGQTVAASFYDINLDTAHIDDIGTDSGALVANMYTYGLMDNCHAYNIDMTVLGVNIGGLNGGALTESTITNCSFSGSVTGINQVGGLSGNIWDKSTISNSYVEGEVHGEYIVGGLVGFGTMAFGPDRESILKNSYNRASVEASDPVGMVGGVYGYAQAAVHIENVYSTGTVEGQDFVGAFVGKAEQVEIENSYFDRESSQLDNAVGGNTGDFDIEAKSTDEMTTQAMADALNNDDPDGPWAFDEIVNDAYPYLGDNFLGIEKPIAEELKLELYPTTVKQNFTIDSDAELKTYAIYNLSGQLVKRGDLHIGENHLQVTALESGVYLVQIHAAEGTFTKRIIKN